MAFDLGRAGFGKAGVSKLDTNIMIPIGCIEHNQKNFYGLRGIETLAESMKVSGLIQPIAVVQTGPGKYRCISGHRRLAAAESLDWVDIPARILESLDDVGETLALVLANSTQRELTGAERLKGEETLRASLMALKDSGQEIPKNLSEYMAKKLGTSRNEVSRMHSINENLIPEARAELDAGMLNMSTAYQMSRKSEDEQRAILAAADEWAADAGTEKQKYLHALREKQAAENIDTPASPPPKKPESSGIREKIQADQERARKEVETENALIREFIEMYFGWFPTGWADDIANRNDGIRALTDSARYSGHYGGGKFNFQGNGSKGLYITAVLDDGNKNFHVGWATVYDALAAEALKRAFAKAPDDEPDEMAPKAEPEIIRQTVLDAAWQTGVPVDEGEYVCEFDLGTTRMKRFCEWKETPQGGKAWFFLNGNQFDRVCLRWIKLPEEN